MVALHQRQIQTGSDSGPAQIRKDPLKMLVCSVARIHQIQDSAEVAPQAFQRDRTQTDDLKIDYSFAQPASPQSLTYPNKLIYRDQSLTGRLAYPPLRIFSQEGCS